MLLPNETILKAISWTLLHSLWQGLILAIFAGLVILFTKKAKANLRYSILSGLFLAFMIAVGFTFNYEYQSDAMFISSEELIVMEDFNQDEILLPASEAPDYFQMGINFLNQNSKTIVFIWFLIFSIKCFGIFRSLSNIYRIRNYRNQEVPEYWSQRVLELSQILKIKKKIVLLESQLVSVPSVTGFFKPIILIPIGLLSNLPQDQIEAILLHELAHIRRKDYFINLIQSFAEILFFFNPGVLWVSSIIKEERENCCDDIAVGITKSKSKFIHALVSFQEYNMKQNELAMGFGSKKNQLLERAKRIIHDNNKSLNSIEKTFLSICIIIIASFTVACSNTKAATIQSNDEVAFGEEFEVAEISPEEGLPAYEEAMMEAEVAEAEALAEAESDAEVAVADAEVAHMEAEEAYREAEKARIEAEKATKEAKEANLSPEELKQIKEEVAQAQEESRMAKIEAERAKKEFLQAKIEGERARAEGEKSRKEGELVRTEGAKLREEGRLARIEGIKARQESRLARTEAERERHEEVKKRTESFMRKRLEISESEGENDFSKLTSQKQKLEAMKAKIEADQQRLEVKKALIQSQIDLEILSKQNISVSSKFDSKNDKLGSTLYIVGEREAGEPATISDQIIAELLKEKIIKSTKNLTFKLSTSKLIVNNKEISGAVQKRLKKYLPEGITATYYNYDISKEN